MVEVSLEVEVMEEDEEEAMVVVTSLTRTLETLILLMVNEDLNETIYSVITVRSMDTLNHKSILKISH